MISGSLENFMRVYLVYKLQSQVFEFGKFIYSFKVNYNCQNENCVLTLGIVTRYECFNRKQFVIITPNRIPHQAECSIILITLIHYVFLLVYMMFLTFGAGLDDMTDTPSESAIVRKYGPRYFIVLCYLRIDNIWATRSFFIFQDCKIKIMANYLLFDHSRNKGVIT